MIHKFLFSTFSIITTISLISCSNNVEENINLNSNIETIEILNSKYNIKLDTDLGESTVDGEVDKIKELEDYAIKGLKKDFKKAPMTRDVHAKHHGCVKAFFKVDSSNLPPELRVGVFSENKEYLSWIRFSNGGSKSNAPDKKGDIRGFALKVMGVSGKKILESEANEQTQDFVMINSPIMFINRLQDYVHFSKAMTEGSIESLKFAITHPSVILRLFNIFRQKISNPLEISYFSSTAYKLNNKAIKFKVQPCSIGNSIIPSNPNNNYLREALVKSLNQDSGCFNFMLQVNKGDFKKMPVEDPTIEWEEKSLPFVKVATLIIPKQFFDTPEQNKFCENMSFTPWHSLPEHKPLGAVNRARKAVYETVSKFRHENNNSVRKEPTSHQIF